MLKKPENDFPLKRFREEFRLSKTAMAKRVGIDRPTYAALEISNRPLSVKQTRLIEHFFLDMAIQYKRPDLLPPRLRAQLVELWGLDRSALQDLFSKLSSILAVEPPKTIL